MSLGRFVLEVSFFAPLFLEKSTSILWSCGQTVHHGPTIRHDAAREALVPLRLITCRGDSFDPIPPEAQAALDQFKAEADKIIDGLIGGPEATKTPPSIHHYTDDVGLRGILETGRGRQ